MTAIERTLYERIKHRLQGCASNYDVNAMNDFYKDFLSPLQSIMLNLFTT